MLTKKGVDMDILLNKKNRTGVTSVVIEKKSNGEIIKTIGVNSNGKIISELYRQKKQLIKVKGNKQSIALYKEPLKDYLTHNIENIVFMTSTLDYPHPQPTLRL